MKRATFTLAASLILAGPQAFKVCRLTCCFFRASDGISKKSCNVYHLVHEVVEIRSAATTVEIFHKGQRMASHLRGRGHEKAITEDEHRPKSHLAHLEWTPSRMVNWAGTIGPNTAQLFERILADKPHPEMGSLQNTVRLRRNPQTVVISDYT